MMVDTGLALTDTKRLVALAMETKPSDMTVTGNFYQSLLHHIRHCSDALPALVEDNDRLVKDVQELQFENKNLTGRLSVLDHERNTLRDEVGVGEKQITDQLASMDHLRMEVSRLEEELFKARERQKLAIDTKKRLIDSSEELKKELKEVQEREAIINKHNSQLIAQRKERELEREVMEREKVVLETGLASTRAKRDAVQQELAASVVQLSSLNALNQDLSQRLDDQEQARLKAEICGKAAEDRCCDLQHELSTAMESVEDLKAHAAEQTQEFKTTLDEVQAKAKASQAQQDRMTKEVTDLRGSIQRLESGLEGALSRATAFEKEKTDLFGDLQCSRSREEHLRKALAEDSEETAMLNTNCQQLLQQVSLLKEKSDTQAEEVMNLRGKIQQLDQALEDSQARTTTSESERTKLLGELDVARERESTLEQALKQSKEDSSVLKEAHTTIALQFQIAEGICKTYRAREAEMKSNEMQSPSNEPSDAEPSTKNAKKLPFFRLRPEDSLPKQPPPSTVATTPVVTAEWPESRPHTPVLVSAGQKTTHTPNATSENTRQATSTPSVTSSSPTTVSTRNTPLDPTPFFKKRNRPSEFNGQGGSNKSKRAMRRKRHRQQQSAGLHTWGRPNER